MKQFDSVDSIAKSSRTSRWFLAGFFLLSQITVGIVSYLIIHDANDRSAFVEAEIDGLPEVEILTTELQRLGQYRGSCSALLTGDAELELAFSERCSRAAEALRAVDILPLEQLSSPTEFFEQLTAMSRDRLNAIEQTFIDSNAILDPEHESYQLGFLVYRLYPNLIEAVGRIRGQEALVAAGELSISELHRSLGKLEYLIFEYQQNNQVFTLENDEDISFNISQVKDYVRLFEGITEEAVSAGGLDAATRDFDKATVLIGRLKGSITKDVVKLLELYQSRLNDIQTTRNIWIILLVLVDSIWLLFAWKYLAFLRHLHLARIREHEAVVSLEAMLGRQKEMFAVIGHELRTPVAAISMLGKDTEIDAAAARTEILSISENLLSVLEDLRVVVAPERALEAKQVEDSDPVRTIKRALTPLAGLLKENSIELQLNLTKPEKVIFSLHAQPLRQVVTNLVKNAAIHSGGTAVHVSFDYQMEAAGGASACLIVEDDGTGIPEDLRQHVFDAFGRGDTAVDGSGLGLFIVKQIASIMAGELTYSTSRLGGACFTLRFSMQRVEAAESTQTDGLSLEGLRILLAEDDAMLRMLTEKSLSKLGAQITSYDNGQKALAAYQSGRFDLVLTDIMMPVMDGHELTRSLRALGSSTPIIGVTAAVIGEETDGLLAAGACAFIAKPITPSKLQEALDEIGFTRSQANC